MRKDLIPIRRFNTGMSIFDEFDRIFEQAFGRMSPANQQNNYPVANIFVDTEDVLNFEFALAGFTKDEVVAEVEDNILTVKAEKSEQDEDENKYIVRRFSRRSFVKQYNLGDLYDPDTADASMEDGVLKVTFQKKVLEQPESKVKRLEI